MKYIKYITLATICSSFVACNSYDFEQEQYRKEVNLLQDREGVYDRQVLNMADEGNEKGAILNLVVGLSGSTPSDKDYEVTLLKSDSLFKAYNKSNFDIEKERYARVLPKECYDEPKLTATIPCGDSKVLIPIKIKNMERLSPDSIYMLNYEFDKTMATPFNPKKSHVLLRVHWKNLFASTADHTMYNYGATNVITPAETPGGAASIRRPTHAIQAFPLTKNSVRFLAGDEEYGDYKKALEQINQKSVIFEVGAQLPENPRARRLTIKPYRSEEIEVVQLTPEGIYDNAFELNELKVAGGGASTYYKEFRFHYKYRLLKQKNSDGTVTVGKFKEVKGRLRHQYQPRAEQL